MYPDSCKMSLDVNVDRISSLPKHIIDLILTRLPLWDAVRTSILSRSWRYEWCTISEIVINCFSFPFYDDLRQAAQSASDARIVKIIDNMLLLHCGSIDKFSLNIELVACDDIDRWVLYVSRHGIKELIINKWTGEFYKIPSCLFSCTNLSYLELTRCSYIPPVSFKEFSRLTELFLFGVKFTGNGLNVLLSSCPLLERLSLWRIVGIIDCPESDVKISAPNLVMFHVREVYYIQFKNIPLLASASFELGMPLNELFELFGNRRGCNIVELLCCTPSLQSLEFRDYALQHFAVGYVPARLPVVCPIKVLIVHVNFEDMQQMQAAFCILRSSPNIRRLKLTVFSDKTTSRISAERFWEATEYFCFKVGQLQEVEVTDFTGIKYEVNFIKFILANAPALEMMCINFHENVEDVLATVTELTQFPRISSKAELILPIYSDM